jgi:hypothetical membrane protein
MTENNKTGLTPKDASLAIITSGTLLFLSGFLIFMGIITCEMFYTLPFNTRGNYISELAAALPPNAATPHTSAVIFNLTMIVTGLMVVVAGILLQKSSKKLLSTIPLMMFGAGITGVGVCPGNVIPWHGIFAIVIFLTGGIGAITSFKIVKGPLRYALICFGIIALILLFFSKKFIPILGAGGAERWLFYPEVFWIMGLGGYLLGYTNRHKDISAYPV